MCSDNDIITDEDLVIKIKENVIPFDIAKKMYESDDEQLKNYALTLYTHQELSSINLLELKNFDDMDKCINTDFDNDPNTWIIDCIDYLNGEEFDYINSECYLPSIKVVKAIEYEGKPEHCLAKFAIDNTSYFILAANKSSFTPFAGLFNYDTENKFGCVSFQMSSFACATKEIAMFISKYYAKELFMASMIYFLDKIKWYDI